MSLAEIKDRVAELNAEERLEVAAWIVHLNRAEDPDYQTTLDRRLAAMEAGRKSIQAQLEHLHTQLSTQG